MKTCSKCGVEKPLTEFRKRSRTRDGLQYYCQECGKAYHHAGMLRYRAKYPDRVKASQKSSKLKAAYGVSTVEKEALIVSQKGRCACCGDIFESSRHAHIDHIHGSCPVIIRGVLCPQCNTGLGLFKDSTERLLKAIAYLKNFENSP